MDSTFLEADSNYSFGGTRRAEDVKYIVIHYTGNNTDTAMNNAKYFAPGGYNATHDKRYAGAHYFISDDTIVQSVRELRVAYAVGGTNYGGKMHGKITNYNSISIELCSRNSSITEATLATAVGLCKELMEKYNIPVQNIYRHYDVTAKQCPGWPGWFGTSAPKWDAFKARFSSADLPRVVRITAKVLNVRSGPGTKYDIVGTVSRPVKYTIVEQRGNWGRLKSGVGWICLNYTE